MITFTDTAGNERTGELWSNGPLSRTAWVLLPGGSTAAVHLNTLREVPAPIDPRWRVGGPAKYGLDGDRARLHYRDQFRYGPVPIRVREWAQYAALFEVA